MDPISIALGLAQFVPSAIRFFSGDDTSKAAAAADKLIGVAKTVTGMDSGDEALAAIKADPALALQLQQSWMAHEVAMLQEDTRQLAEINATIRAEAASSDKYVSRWRPTFGYAMAATWTAQMGAVSWAIIAEPTQAPAIINAMVNTAPIWAIALAVLGVSVASRTKDKAIAAGATPPASLLAGLVGKVTGRG
jgi:hypothetical protein